MKENHLPNPISGFLVNFPGCIVRGTNNLLICWVFIECWTQIATNPTNRACSFRGKIEFGALPNNGTNPVFDSCRELGEVGEVQLYTFEGVWKIRILWKKGLSQDTNFSCNKKPSGFLEIQGEMETPYEARIF